MSRPIKPPDVPRSRIRLKRAIKEAGGEWILRVWGNERDSILDRISKDIDDFAKEYERLFGDKADPWELLKLNPTKAAAFFHMDTLSASVDMKVMVWRILLGCEIVEVRFDYQTGVASKLFIKLRAPNGQEPEEYESSLLRDFAVLRHLGTTVSGGKLVLQGYYGARMVGS